MKKKTAKKFKTLSMFHVSERNTTDATDGGTYRVIGKFHFLLVTDDV